MQGAAFYPSPPDKKCIQFQGVFNVPYITRDTSARIRWFARLSLSPCIYFLYISLSSSRGGCNICFMGVYGTESGAAFVTFFLLSRNTRCNHTRNHLYLLSRRRAERARNGKRVGARELCTRVTRQNANGTIFFFFDDRG